MFDKLKKIFGSTQDDRTPQVQLVEAPGDQQTTISHQFISDQPINVKSEDRFNRSSFATRIAETINTRQDPSSIVIGLYGPWGDGKTSVLGMMEEVLTSKSSTIVIKFNPWYFQTEESLLRGFFKTLADALGKSLPNLKEKAGELLNKYGGLLSFANITFAGMVEFSPGETAQSMGKTLSNVDLDELRDRIEAMLAESHKRLVILIDDIDRLDRDETHAIFKLVKLSASFKHTAYVLAFDDEVVSASLGTRYGKGDSTAGRAFLEKIIQVPLHLPPAEEQILLEITWEGIQVAYDQAGINLSPKQASEFALRFESTLLPKLETPRRTKLYSNALLFALPILKNEVNPVDLMLLEGLRIIHPKLYSVIRNNPDSFLLPESDVQGNGFLKENTRVGMLIKNATPDLTYEERETLKNRLLKELFPRISGNYSNALNSVWNKEQRVCSVDYFKRFFAYGMPQNDISDLKIRAFCESTLKDRENELRAPLEDYANSGKLPLLLTKIGQFNGLIKEDEALGIVKLIVNNCDLFPHQPNLALDLLTRASILVEDLVSQISSIPERNAIAKYIIQKTSSLLHAFVWTQSLFPEDNIPEEDRLFTKNEELALNKLLAKRIEEAEKISPILLTHPDIAGMLYSFWATHSGIAKVRKVLKSLIDSNPKLLDTLMISSLKGVHGASETSVSDFDYSAYRTIRDLLDPEYILDNLENRFGFDLESKDVSDIGDPSVSAAQRFMSIHKYVQTHLKDWNIK